MSKFNHLKNGPKMSTKNRPFHPLELGAAVIYFMPLPGGKVRPVLGIVGRVFYNFAGKPVVMLHHAREPLGGHVDAFACLPLTALENLSSDNHGETPEPLPQKMAGVLAG